MPPNVRSYVRNAIRVISNERYTAIYHIYDIAIYDIVYMKMAGHASTHDRMLPSTTLAI